MSIGRTNINLFSGSESGDSGGSGEGVTLVDLPEYIASISVSSVGNGKIVLDLSYNDTSLITGVELRYKTGSYPASPEDGLGLTIEGTPSSITVLNLANSVKYYFRVYPYREIDGIKYYQTINKNSTTTGIASTIEISGMAPVMSGDTFLVLANSGTFTLKSTSDITFKAYVVGGGCKGSSGGDGHFEGDTPYGGDGGAGGYGGPVTIHQNILLPANTDISCTLSIGSANSAYNQGTKSTFKFNNTSYTNSSYYYKTSKSVVTEHEDGGSGTNGMLTPYGYVGSSGGGGGGGGSTEGNQGNGGSGGIGAGDGGIGGSKSKNDSTGLGPCYSTSGRMATHYGCGGGGGGGGSYPISSAHYKGSSGGAGKQGCLILEWT